MGSNEEMLSTRCPRDKQWQWLDKDLFMAPFPYGCPGLPHSPHAYFMVSLEMSTLHLSLTQVSYHRPTLKVRLTMV